MLPDLKLCAGCKKPAKILITSGRDGKDYCPSCAKKVKA